MNQNGNVLTINQGTDRLIMGWNSFSVGAGETTRFVQPSSSSFALNRVTGGTQSLINGHLEANGGVILINPAGIIVGNSGVVNVNSFIASTRDVTDSDFLSGKSMKFQGNSEASIQNLGTIHAESGDIYLIAHSIINSGTLSAEKGTVGLAAANEVLLQPAGDEKLSILTQESSGGKIVNSGTIRAVTAEIKAAGNPYAVAINLDGVIETHAHPTSGAPPKVTIRATQGDIQMSSGSKITANGKSTAGQVTIQTIGNLEISGTVLATSSAGTGGTINLLGKNIHLDPSVVVDASGFLGGGKIFVGGDYQGGKNPDVHYSSTALPTAQTLQVDQGAKLSADATGNGNGGTIIQWSDGTTVSSGSVSVQGGPLGGNGGFAEISGKQNLGFDGTVNVGAVKGTPGTVLFDPAQIQITSATDLSVYSEPAITGMATNQISYTDYSKNQVWVMSQSFFTDFTSGTIILQAYNISLEDPQGNNRANIVLNRNVNLELHSMDGGTDPKIYLPSAADGGDATRSSITASGSGYVKLDASPGSQLILHGDITTASGDIILISQNDVDLKGASLKSTDGGAIKINSSIGNIVMNGSQIAGTSGAIQITAANGSFAATNSIISNSSGPISIIGQTGLNLTGSSIQSTSGDIAVSSPAGGITMYSYAPGEVEANRIGSTISSGSGSVTLASKNEIYLGGSTIWTTGTNGGSVSLTSTGSFIKLYSDSIGPSTVIQSAIQTVGGNITLKGEGDGSFDYAADPALYNYAVTLDGASLSSETGNINITPTTGGIWLYYGSLSSATTIQTGSGNINLTGQSLVKLDGALLKSTNGGSVSLISPNSCLLNSKIQTTGGDIEIQADYNQLSYSQIQSAAGHINVSSESYTYLEDPSSYIKSSATGDAVVISSTQYFYNGAGTNALQAPNGRWIVYLPSPQYLGNWAEPLNSANDAIWSTTAGQALAPDKTGNRYVFASAPSGQITLLNTSKVYGQSWTPSLGRDYTIAAPNSSGAFTMAASDFSGVTLESLGYDAKATVGPYLVNFVSATGGNITLAPESSASITVTPAMLTLGVCNVSKVYDGTKGVGLGSDNFVLSGLCNGDSVGLINTPTSGVYATNGAGTGILVTANRTKGLGLTGSLASNYLLNTASTISGYGDITPAMLTATLIGSVSKVYDGTTDAKLTKENYQLVDGSGKVISSISGAIGTITPATLTASLTGDVSKQYNGDTIAKISPANYILNGKIYASDVINLGLNNPVTGSYDNPNPGAGINVTVNGLALTGSAAPNYQLVSTTINAPIGSITALPPPPPSPSTVGTGTGFAITGVINTPDFKRMVQAAVPPPPSPAPAGPAGPAMGGSFGSAGPSSGGGGFSQPAGEAVAGGPASAPPPQEGSGQSGAGASDPNSPPPSQNGAPVADNGSAPAPNGSAPAANGAPVAANGSPAGGASGASGGSAGTGGAAGGSHTGGAAGTSSGSGSPGQTPVHLPASVAVSSRLNSPVSVGNSAAAAFNRLNPSISAGEGLSEGSASSSGEAAPSQGAAQVNQSRASRFGGIGSDSTPGGDLNSMVQMLAL